MAPRDSGYSPDLILLLYYPMPWNTTVTVSLRCGGEVYVEGSGPGQLPSVDYFNASSGGFHHWGGVNEDLTMPVSTGICGEAGSLGLRFFIVRIAVDAPYALKLHRVKFIFRGLDVDLIRKVMGYTLIIPMDRISSSLTSVQVSDAWLAALIISSIIFLLSAKDRGSRRHRPSPSNPER